MLVEAGIEGDGIAFAGICPQLLAETTEVVGDQAVGGLEDGVGGAIVLLQPDDLRREVLVELLDVLDLGTAPAVDGLIIVAHHHETGAILGKVLEPGVLDGVGVLEFVHQQVLEAPLVVFEQAGVVAPEIQGAQQQLGEIDHPGAGAGRLVGFVDAAHGAEEEITSGLDVLRPQAFILLAIDEPLRLARWPALFIETQLADHPLDDALLVVAVEDLEIL